MLSFPSSRIAFQDRHRFADEESCERCAGPVGSSARGVARRGATSFGHGGSSRACTVAPKPR